MSDGQREKFRTFLNQQIQRDFHLKTISSLQEKRQVYAELQKLLKEKTWIDFATVLAWQEWIKEEMENYDE